MRIVEKLIGWMWSEVREIISREFYQSTSEMFS